MAKKVIVGGRIESKEVGGIVTGAAEILDDTKGKKQSVINGETDDELLRLDQSKQDNLTFDNAPTEGSDNPVKSGGLYTAQQAILLAIAAINELIPSAASALNQLADKAFVNSSISTNTATFRGTSAAGLNEQQFLAWANGLEHDLNDYVFWQTSDAAGNTLFKRYKWNGTEWAYEYTLNNSTFTAEQWEAIQSGITALLVAKLRALPTAQELIQSFDGKQDVLTFDNVPTLGSNNPVKSSGIYNVIKAITDLVPAEATAQNQLADKADVAAKILAAIPSWKGQYDALTDLQAVMGAKAGDMGCVKTTDRDGHAVLTFYQYSAQSTWVVYYTLHHYAQNKPATTGTTGDYPYNGMGRIELQKNIVNGVNTLTQAMLTQQNTIYVIQYDFTLGEDITVPANCVLEFDGGSVKNGNIVLQNTIVRHGKEKIFENIILSGTSNSDFYITNFGCVIGNGNEIANNNALLKAFVSLDNLGSVKSYDGCPTLIVPEGNYYFSTPLVSAGKFDFICEGLLVYTGDTVSTAITIGNNTQVIEFKEYRFKIAQDSQRAKVSGVVPENIGVKIINLYNSKVTFDYISKFCYGIVLVGDGYGFGYNTIHLNDFGDYHYTALKLMALNEGWINQNTFFGGKVHSYTNSIYSGEDIAIHIIGTSTHVSNENTFYSQCLEGSYTAIKLEYAKDNRFVYPRYEAVTNKRVEDGNSYDNVFIGGWNNEDAGYDLNLSSRLMQMALVRRDKVKVYSNGSGGSGKASTNVCATTLYVSEYNEMQHFADASGALIGYMVDATYCKSFFFRKSEELNLNKIYLRLFDASGNEIEFNDTTILITDYVKSRTKFRYVANYNNNVMTNANTREVYFSVVDSVKKVFIGAAGGTGTIELYAPFKTVPRVINPKENVVSFVPNATVGCEVGDRVFCTSLNKPIFIKTLNASGVPTWVDGAGNAV